MGVIVYNNAFLFCENATWRWSCSWTVVARLKAHLFPTWNTTSGRDAWNKGFKNLIFNRSKNWLENHILANVPAGQRYFVQECSLMDSWKLRRHAVFRSSNQSCNGQHRQTEREQSQLDWAQGGLERAKSALSELESPSLPRGKHFNSTQDTYSSTQSLVKPGQHKEWPWTRGEKYS